MYGWSTWHGLAFLVGPTLGPGAALGAAALVLAASLAVHVALRHARFAAARAWARRSAILEVAFGWLLRVAGALRPR